jgi:hypothetical protein
LIGEVGLCEEFREDSKTVGMEMNRRIEEFMKKHACVPRRKGGGQVIRILTLDGKRELELAYPCQVGLRRSERKVEMVVVEGVDPAV